MKIKIGAVSLALAGLAAGLLVATGPANAASGPIFTVMNTSETPPDGVYFRNTPTWGDTSRTYGLGVFMNEQVQLECYTFGQAIGPYNDSLWYYTLNVSRPVNYNGVPNQGLLDAHYINDGQNANVVDAGVPVCVNNLPPVAPSPPPATPIAGFYSPFNVGARGDDGKVEDLQDQSGIYTANVNTWYACSAASDAPYFALEGQLAPGQYYDRVGGWSLGRLGPAYLIQGMQEYNPNLLRQLNYIILIDPGSYSDMSQCDIRNGSGNLYADWLKYNTDARLVILSGTKTQASSSKGIQQIYFNPIRNQAAGTNIRSRVLVCNYNAGHYPIYDAGQYWIKHVISSNSCPTLNYNRTRWHPTAVWHP